LFPIAHDDTARDNTIRIWDVIGMTALAVLDRMSCCALDLVLNGTCLYAACIDTRIAVLDVSAVLAPASADNVSPISVHLSDAAQFYGHHLGFVVSTAMSRYCDD
jgi:hypothetical protein